MRATAFAKQSIAGAAMGVMVLLATGCATQNGAVTTAGQASAPSELKRLEGIVSGQVVQRDARGFATIKAGGTTSASGKIWGRVIRGCSKVVVEVVAPRVVGDARDGKWLVAIEAVPTGGPYEVQLALQKGDVAGTFAKVADDVFVGDLWILAGQSNMQGWGDLRDVETPDPNIRMFESRYQWAIAEEPLHRLSESPDAVHHRIANPKMTREQIDKKRAEPRVPQTKGAGLGLPFAKELYARTKVPIGLVPCAHGGTSMEQWDPARAGEKGDSLYGSMLQRFEAVGGRVKGVLWYQGESDANPKAQPVYREKFTAFIAQVRKDFKQIDLPFYLVQLSRVSTPVFPDTAWNAVQEDQRQIAAKVTYTRAIPAIDLDLDDTIHIGVAGLKRLGRRMAIVADHDVFGNHKIDIGPQLESAKFEKPGLIRVTYSHVNGSLQPAVHIAGFSLTTADGKPGPEFWDVEVDTAQPNSVLLHFYSELKPGTTLSYGRGLNPYCNLTDSQDMAAPVFGPILVGPPATTPAK